MLKKQKQNKTQESLQLLSSRIVCAYLEIMIALQDFFYGVFTAPLNVQD